MDSSKDDPEKDSVTEDAKPDSSEESTDTKKVLAPGAVNLPIVESNNGRGRLFGIIASLAALFVLVLGAMTVFFLDYSKNVQQNATTRFIQQEKSKDIKDAANALEEVKKIVKLPVIKEELNATEEFAKDENGYVVYTYPLYKLDDVEYASSPTKVTSVVASGDWIKDKAAIAKAYEETVAFLEDHNFAQKELIETPQDAEMSKAKDNESAIYASDKTVCVVRALHFAERKKRYVSVVCADITSYQEKAQVLKPFYDAYTAKHPEAKDLSKKDIYLTLRGPILKDGIEGYKGAHVGMFMGASGSGLVRFYQAPGEAWKFASETVAEMPFVCDDFVEAGPNKAFRGEYCYDKENDKDSTITEALMTKADSSEKAESDMKSELQKTES